MSSWIDEAITEERRKDMLRAAARRRQVALAAHHRPSPFYSAVLVGLGRRLEAWGCGLQAHYGAFADAGITAPAGDGACR